MRLFFVVVPLLLAHRSASAAPEGMFTEPGELPRLSTGEGGEEVALPLEHTHFEAEVTGYVAEVVVTQRYENPYTTPIDVTYVFPLPERSAVADMRMVIGARVINADVQERQQARQTYEQARQQGHTAALLEQERPNVFTQSITNIEPGHTIEVVIRYLQTLTYDDGSYELVLPMVVGPRFSPSHVRDAARLSPPVLPLAVRTGHDVSLEVVVDAGFPVRHFEVPTHEVETSQGDGGVLLVRLARHDEIPNRDFVLRYQVAASEPQATLLTHKGERGGYFTLIVQPPQQDLDALVGQRELVFVVDVSGSMAGLPLAMCQDAMEHALGMLRPSDTFNVLTFAGQTSKLFATAQAASEANVRRGVELIRGLGAGGGTHMLDAISEALTTDVEPGRNRYVFFMTDGYVGNETEIMSATERYVRTLRSRQQQARVFGFGVGSSVNRHLLDGLGTAGEGLTYYATTREDPTLAVQQFFRLIDKPLIEDVRIDWNGLATFEVQPAHLPDLFATRPLIVHGRYREGGTARVQLRGKSGGREVVVPLEVTLPTEPRGTAVIGTLWARAKIETLSRQQWTGEVPAVKQEITDLGIAWRLATAYTSFVAVDPGSRVSGPSRLVTQPVFAPEGVDPTMAGAPMWSGNALLGRAGGQLHGKGSGHGVAGVSGHGVNGRSFGAGAPSMDMAPPYPAKIKTERRETERSHVAPRPRPELDKKRDAIGTWRPDRHIRALRVSAALSKSDVARRLARKLAALRTCTGKPVELTLRFVLDAGGSVHELFVLRDGGLDRSALGCLTGALRATRFGESSAAGAEIVTTVVID